MRRWAMIPTALILTLAVGITGCSKTEKAVAESTGQEVPGGEVPDGEVPGDGFPGGGRPGGDMFGGWPDGVMPDGGMPKGGMMGRPGGEMPDSGEMPNDGFGDPSAIEGESPEIDVDKLFTERDLKNEPKLSDADGAITAKNNSEHLIEEEGTYILSGTAENFTVIVDVDKKDKVQIVLYNAEITNEDRPVIEVKSADKCFVTSVGENRLEVTGAFSAEDDEEADAVIYSKDDLTLNGTGKLLVVSTENGITAKDDLKITGGEYEISCAETGIDVHDSVSIYDGTFVIEAGADAFKCQNKKDEGAFYIRNGSFTLTAGDDGIQAEEYLVIDGGEFDITAKEGLESTFVRINGGTVKISATDDGINASNKNSEYRTCIEINGGEITVSAGPGDTDCLDSNGTIVVNGGTISVTGNSTFDADFGSTYNGGVIIVNGTQVDSIPASMQGGGRGDGGFWGPGDSGFGGRGGNP